MTYDGKDPYGDWTSELRKLSLLMPEMADQFRDIGDLTVREYISRSVNHQATQTPCQLSRELLGSFLRQVAAGRLPNQDGNALVARWLNSPIIHTGSHSQLILEPACMAAAVIADMAASETSADCLVHYTCSTITLESKRRTGPGWLTNGSGLYKLANVPNHKMGKISVCAHQGELILPRQALWPLEIAQSEVDMRPFGRAMLTVNERIWHSLNSFQRRRYLAFDEWDLADLLADHCENPLSPLAMVLFEDRRRAALDEEWNASRSKRSGIFLPKDWNVWCLGGGKIGRTAISDGKLIDVDRKTTLAYWCPEEIARLLRMRIILPSLFLIYCAIAILPEILVTGGGFMMGYVPLFRRILSNVLRMHRYETKITEVREGKVAFFFRLLRDQQIERKLWSQQASGTMLEELAEYYSNTPLMEATRAFEGIRENAKWKLMMGD